MMELRIGHVASEAKGDQDRDLLPLHQKISLLTWDQARVSLRGEEQLQVAKPSRSQAPKKVKELLRLEIKRETPMEHADLPTPGQRLKNAFSDLL